MKRRRKGRHPRREVEAGIRAVWPGVEGGAYRPLTEADMERIHTTVLDLLENVGLSQAIPSVVERVTAAGGRVTDKGRLLFPRALVEDVIAGCKRDFVLPARNGASDITLSDTRVYAGFGGASPNIVDLETGKYREATLKDLYDVARLVDTLDHIHFFNRSPVARDVGNQRDFDINTVYAALAGTSKHVGTSFFQPQHLDQAMKMFHKTAGGEEAFRERPFCTALCCHVVPPLRFAEDSCAVAEAAALNGMPVMLIAAGQAGATSPAPLAGSVVQAVAETLAGLVFVYLVDPGVECIFAPKPLVSDLRTGAMSGGGGEQAVLMAAAAQMAHFYDLRCSVMAGITDSKVPDAQHGYGKAYTVSMAAQVGTNMITQSCGMEASLLGCSFEGYVIDNDMLGAILRSVRGIEVNDDTLSYHTIDEVVNGEGHCLGHDQTIDAMIKDYVYPELGDRQSPSDWEDAGGKDIRTRARERAREILSSHFPQHIAPDTDTWIRDHFDILLPREVMRA